MIDYRYTTHQVARGSRPDAEIDGALLLLKNVPALRLTYQIRLLTFLATTRMKRLEIRVPKDCRPSAALQDFLKEHRSVVSLQKV